MAYKIRTSGKTREFKKSEELLPALDSLNDSIRKYGTTMLVAAGVLILLAGAVWGFFWYQGRQENDASGLVYQASGYYHQQPGLNAEEGTPVPTREENLKKALELFGEVIQKYPGTHSSALSQYYIGNSHLELGQFDEAIAAYQTYLDRYHPSGKMAGLALQRMGSAYQSKGDTASAEDAFKKALDTEQALNKDQVLYAMGRLLEGETKKEEAVVHYQRLIQEYPTSVLIPDTRARLRGLGVAGEPSTPSGGNPEISPAPTAPAEIKPGAPESKK